MVTNIQNKQYYFLQAAKRGANYEFRRGVTVAFSLCHFNSIARETI